MTTESWPVVIITITHVMSWRASYWAEHLGSRQAWLVACPEHPYLGHDREGNPWGYATQRIARSVAARHGNSGHQWPQHDETYDVAEIEAAP